MSASVGVEGIVIGEVDLEAAIPYYPIHDRVGYHGRPDVFRFSVNRKAFAASSSILLGRKRDDALPRADEG